MFFPKVSYLSSTLRLSFSHKSGQEASAYGFADKLVDRLDASNILYANKIEDGELVMVVHRSPRSMKLLMELADGDC